MNSSKEDKERGNQNSDGNTFLRKVGRFFREEKQLAVGQKTDNKQKTGDAAAEVIENKTEVCDGKKEEKKLTTIDKDSDSENTSISLISEQDLFLAGLNVNNIHAQLVYETINNVRRDISQAKLFSYIQEVCKMSREQQQELIMMAKKKEVPKIVANTKVIEAKELMPKDSNGLSDPFVTLFLGSDKSRKYKTVVKPATLNPIWEEEFVLPVKEPMPDDKLILEIWDFDKAESTTKKIGKLSEVKGVVGFGKYLKECTSTAKIDQTELIGTATISLKLIPVSGTTLWYSLGKKKGELKVGISFSSDKNSQEAKQELRDMLKIILIHELKTLKDDDSWSGTFSPQGRVLLDQHIARSCLNPTDVALCEWSIFSAFHQFHALNFGLFSNLLDKLIQPLQTNEVCNEDITIFWEATKELLPSCFSTIRNIRKTFSNEETAQEQVTEVLKILNCISLLEPCQGIDMFPSAVYPWITCSGNEPNIKSTLADAVVQGASEWLIDVLNNNKPQTETNIGKLEQLRQIVQLVQSDLKKAEVYDKKFQDIYNYQYVLTLYKFYQTKLYELIEPDVVKICENNLHNVDGGEEEGKSLFVLYQSVREFVMLGIELFSSSIDEFHLTNFHQWFHNGVVQWLEIAACKAQKMIEKAVDLDKFTLEDDNVKCSSSAVDSLAIFIQVKEFWRNLNWPDPESSYTFVLKIITDVCRSYELYADKISTRVLEMKEEKIFEVTSLAIKNIEYLADNLKPFIQDLGIKQIIENLSGVDEVDGCQIIFVIEKMYNNMVESSIDTMRNKIILLMKSLANMMVPSIKMLLIETAESGNEEKLMNYIDQNLNTLYGELNDENFKRNMEIFWKMFNATLENIIQANLNKKRPPSFFACMHQTVNLMLEAYGKPSECDLLFKTQRILNLYGLETNDLIHKIYLDLANEFRQLEESPYGELNVRVKFVGSTIKVEVINARILVAMDSNGLCDPFVEIYCLPEYKFTGLHKLKTKCHKKTLFPLFDETFEISLSKEQKATEDGLLLFSVQDKDLLGAVCENVGLTFITFKDITDSDESLSSLPQIRLQLGRPAHLNNDGIKVLEQRQGEKTAKDFLRKINQCMDSLRKEK